MSVLVITSYRYQRQQQQKKKKKKVKMDRYLMFYSQSTAKGHIANEKVKKKKKKKKKQKKKKRDNWSFTQCQPRRSYQG